MTDSRVLWFGFGMVSVWFWFGLKPNQNHTNGYVYIRTNVPNEYDGIIYAIF